MTEEEKPRIKVTAYYEPGKVGPVKIVKEEIPPEQPKGKVCFIDPLTGKKICIEE